MFLHILLSYYLNISTRGNTLENNRCQLKTNSAVLWRLILELWKWPLWGLLVDRGASLTGALIWRSRALIFRRPLSWILAVVQCFLPCLVHSICPLLMSDSNGKLTAYQQMICAQRMPLCWRGSTATLWSLTRQDKPLSSCWTSTREERSTKQGTKRTHYEAASLLSW